MARRGQAPAGLFGDRGTGSDLLLLLPGDKAHRKGFLRFAAAGLTGTDYLLGQPLMRHHVVEGAERALQRREDLTGAAASCLALAAREKAGEELCGIAQLLDRDAQLVPLARVQRLQLGDRLDDPAQALALRILERPDRRREPYGDFAERASLDRAFALNRRAAENLRMTRP